MDPNEIKCDEMDVDKLLGNSFANQKKCFWWVFGEINFVKQGRKDIVDSFTENLTPNNTDKILKLSQNIVEDIKVMKKEHEARIDELENEIQDLKGKLKGLVEVSKEAMYKTIAGVKRVNEEITL